MSRAGRPLTRSMLSTRRSADCSTRRQIRMSRRRERSMSKRPNLAEITAVAGSTRRQGAAPAAAQPVQEEEGRGAAPAKAKPRAGMRQVAAHFPEEVSWQLRELSVEQRTSVQEILGGSERSVPEIRQAGARALAAQGPFMMPGDLSQMDLFHLQAGDPPIR